MRRTQQQLDIVWINLVFRKQDLKIYFICSANVRTLQSCNYRPMTLIKNIFCSRWTNVPHTSWFTKQKHILIILRTCRVIVLTCRKRFSFFKWKNKNQKRCFFLNIKSVSEPQFPNAQFEFRIMLINLLFHNLKFNSIILENKSKLNPHIENRQRNVKGERMMMMVTLFSLFSSTYEIPADDYF